MLGDCSYGKVSSKTVHEFLSDKADLNLFTIDDEHFNEEAHKLIASEFIPQIEKELENE